MLTRGLPQPLRPPPQRRCTLASMHMAGSIACSRTLCRRMHCSGTCDWVWLHRAGCGALQVDLSGVLSNVMDTVAQLAKTNVRLVHHVDPMLPSIIGDRKRLMQILYNLIGEGGPGFQGSNPYSTLGHMLLDPCSSPLEALHAKRATGMVCTP